MVLGLVFSVIFYGLFLFSGEVMAQSDIVRLFTSQEDRLIIERQKRLIPVDQVANASRLTKKISLDAIVVGKKTVIWINHQMIDHSVELNGLVIDPRNATIKGLWISTAMGKKLVKQGQVYLTESGRVVERYEAI